MNETLTFDAGWLARGWLAVAEASSKDKNRGVLNRTVCVEDSYMLLTTWVPCWDHTSSTTPVVTAPDLDEAPLSTVVAIDEDGRAKGLFAYLLKLVQGEGHPEVLVRLTQGPAPESTGPALVFDSFGGDALTIAADDREALLLGLFDGPYPTWRTVWLGFAAQRPRALALNPDILGRVVKAAKASGAESLHWTFGGNLKPAKIDVDGLPGFAGLVMPMRWVGTEEFGVNPPTDDDEVAGEAA